MINDFLNGLAAGIGANAITEAFKSIMRKKKIINPKNNIIDFRSVDEYNQFKLSLLELVDDLSSLEFVFDCVGRFQIVPPNYDIKVTQEISERINKKILHFEELSPFGFRLFSENLGYVVAKDSNESIHYHVEINDPYLNRFIDTLHKRNIGARAYVFQMQRLHNVNNALEILSKKNSIKSKHLFNDEAKNFLIRKSAAVYSLSTALKRAAQGTIFQMDIHRPI